MLEFADVEHRFPGGDGVANLSCTVGPGEVVALVGLNGAGKTTLMRLGLGMLRPQHGVIRIFGHPLTRLPTERWAEVGALIDVPLAYPELTVAENLHIASLLHHGSSAHLEKSMATWNLTALSRRRFRRLSLGNRQRVGLAAAMQHDPRLIVLDEPTNSLDPASVILLREQILRRAQEGAAVLVSSHHLDEVTRIAHRVLLMNAGRLIGELDTSDTDLERVFFERIRADDEERKLTEEAL